ncbi:hypothetical protein SAMN04488700_1192 [Carnobacterium iners]|uniref:Flagellar protein FliT n=1 Tax=Carnobacterium iners TaxID=1073423 RepID=A0A1X7N065_9LACT|nr:hypothetical protein [Carnobacterium iners]SEK21592.1 hypothetical protein SAMN04488114_101178 [Carnobacterium iners]SMH30596.1 hypothetical protein SAMN04488700_1192 [Carnobacterium iners]
MTTTKHWNQMRSELLEKMYQVVTSWDGTTQEALVITEKNQEILIHWQNMTKQVGNEEFLPYTEIEKEKQTEILSFQQRMIASISNERLVVMSQMKQINQKNKVRDNYVSVKRDSLFIDKGL